MIIETHCHLDYLKEKTLDEIVEDAKNAGVEKIITISVDPLNIDEVPKIADAYPMIYFTQGIHPHDAKDADEVVWNKIRTRASHPKMVAVGEIGLDYFYNHSPTDIQKNVFKIQLELAIELQKPVVIHSRDADLDMIEILSLYEGRMTKKGVIHSFSSSLELLQWSIDHGFYIGFNGMTTFKKAFNVHDAVKLCPVDKILFETDSPFLTPAPHRGKENHPSFLPFIIAEIAKIKNIDESELKRKVFENSKTLFGF